MVRACAARVHPPRQLPSFKKAHSELREHEPVVGRAKMGGGRSVGCQTGCCLGEGGRFLLVQHTACRDHCMVLPALPASAGVEMGMERLNANFRKMLQQYARAQSGIFHPQGCGRGMVMWPIMLGGSIIVVEATYSIRPVYLYGSCPLKSIPAARCREDIHGPYVLGNMA